MNEMMVLFPVRTAGQKKEMVRDCKSLYSKRPDCKSARTDGEKNQHLTRMSQSRHRQLHKDMNNYLKLQTDGEGHTMRPVKGYSGSKMRDIFKDYQRYDALKDFYNRNFFKYPDVWIDFQMNRFRGK